ncbi:MAG: ABC transporter ATP-binding protein [Armatimonadota bacterium]|nr:ABC transporter ATP-binding protein [Armatimonadota bacterium]
MLEVEGITVYYGRALAVDNVSLRVAEGAWVALLGPNGAGKTTLLKAILGLVPHRGSVRFLGEELSSLPAWERAQRGLGYAPEGRRIFPRLTVRENLLLGGYRLPDEEKRKALEEVYALFPRLAERDQQPAGTLSGGEQQMLSLGRALMCRPKLLLLDEASLGLMPKVVREFFQVLSRVHQVGLSILMVEQNTRLALQYAEHAYIMEAGRIVLAGSSAEVARHPRLVESYGLRVTVE